MFMFYVTSVFISIATFVYHFNFQVHQSGSGWSPVVSRCSCFRKCIGCFWVGHHLLQGKMSEGGAGDIPVIQ